MKEKIEQKSIRHTENCESVGSNFKCKWVKLPIKGCNFAKGIEKCRIQQYVITRGTLWF